MNDLILDCTRDALRKVLHPRLFESERGYHGAFHIEITRQFDKRGMLNDPRRLLEVEYQKSFGLHRMKQRPDMIFHIPVEVSHASERDNNYAVWAFKLRSTEGDAREDFNKLNQMFHELNYPIGFFINIGDDRNCLEQYSGPFGDRLHATGVVLRAGSPELALKRASG